MQLTPSQHKALDDSRHLAITANAGSGKTSVLVERYVRLFEHHKLLEPRNVVAITFTEAAAAELRKRISDEIASRLNDPARTDRTKRKRLEALRDGLSNAYISTIHAFARRLITAFPVEANVDATFVTLPPAEKKLLVEETLSNVFRNVLQAAYDSSDANHPMLSTFRTLTRPEVTEVVIRLLNSRFRTRKLRKVLHENSDSQIIAIWQQAIERELLPRIETQRTMLHSIFAYVPIKVKQRDLILNALAQFDAAETFQEKRTAYDDAWSSLFTTKPHLRKNLIKDEEKDETIRTFEAKLITGQTLIENLLSKITDAATFQKAHLEYLFHLRNLVTLHDEVEQAYSEAKAQYSMLDFDDQIDRLLLLVSRPDIADELATQFQYILIDEYQDTDETQFDIASSLTRKFGQMNKLAIVGDPKQSIYAFRNADVRVFNQTKKCIEEQTLTADAIRRTPELGLEGAEVTGAITLAESFRTAERPLAYVNRVFRELMQYEESNEDSVEYVPLISAREGEIAGSVRWLVPIDGNQVLSDGASEEESEKSEEAEDINAEGDIMQEVGEADLIAKQILRIVKTDSANFPVHDRSKDSGVISRDPCYGDIAILIRNRNLLAALEQALTHYLIPYSVQRGRGFFDQQEIIDLISYFKFLSSPKDDVSLVGLLRSPIFGLSDTLIYKIHVHTDRRRSIQQEGGIAQSFWDRFLEEATSNTEDLLVKRAATQLEENLKLAGRVDCSVLLEKILNESGIVATYSALPGGVQAIANIDKFLGMARMHDSRGLATLYDFVIRMNDLVERQEDEAQAQTSTANNVQIMTTHGAKGLEFPIVFAAGLGQPFNMQHRYMLDPEYGVLFNKKDLPKPAITALMTLIAERKMLEEEKRILYVALTRAKDHLILSGKKPTSKNSANKNSPLKLLNTLSNDLLTDEATSEIGLVETILRYDASTLSTSEKTLTFAIPVTHSLPETTIALGDDREEREVTIPETHLETYQPAIGLSRFSPSQLLTYIECPTKYYLRYILGVPEDSRLVYEMEPDELAESIRNEFAETTEENRGAAARGPMLGQIIHKLFERIDQLHMGGTLDANAFTHQFDLICAGLGVRDGEEILHYRMRAESDVIRFLGTEYGKVVLTAPFSKTEFSVHAALTENDHLRGILDRFFLTSSGEAHILDYKTDRTTGKQNPKKRERYEFQVRFYAYLVSRLYPEKDSITATLYYTRNGEVEQYKFDTESFLGIEQTLLARISEVRALENIKSLDRIPRNLEHCRECAYFEEAAGMCVVTFAELRLSEEKSELADLALF